MFATLALLVAGAGPAPLIDEKLPVAGLDRVRMESVTLAPFGGAKPSTIGASGHSHPGATYVYVLSGHVLSALGEGPELPFGPGQAWSEAPGEAHYIVNASRSEPAKLLVFFIIPSNTTRFTQPFGAVHKRH